MLEAQRFIRLATELYGQRWIKAVMFYGSETFVWLYALQKICSLLNLNSFHAQILSNACRLQILSNTCGSPILSKINFDLYSLFHLN